MTASPKPVSSTLHTNRTRTPAHDHVEQESAEAWTGTLPNGWRSTRVKRLFRIVNGATPKSSEPSYWNGEIPWATPEDLGALTAQFLRETKRTLSAEGLRSCGASLVPEGSLLLSTRAPIGYVRLAAQPTATNQGCRSLIPQKAVADSRYFYFALIAAQAVLQAYGTGSTFTELSSTELGLVRVPVPPTELQHVIADYLDHFTALIDDLILKKERLIELLEEKRTALVTRAVTKGLDPDVPMKDSGVEWLGEIPEHWEVGRVGALADVRSGYPFSSKDFSLTEGLPLVRIRDLGNEETEARFDGAPVQSARIDSGDLIVGMDGEFNVAKWTGGAALLNQRLSSVRAVRVSQEFLGYVLVYPIKMIERTKFSTTVKHLSIQEIRQSKIPVPPKNEQEEIATYLQDRCQGLVSLSELIDKAIGLLREYRSALITAAVTGKIDVRDHAA